MLKETIRDEKEDQMMYYKENQELLQYVFDDKTIAKIDKRGKLSKSNLDYVRRSVLGLEGWENSASFNEGMLRGLEMFQSSVKIQAKAYKNGVQHVGTESEDYINGMEDMLEYILR